MKRFCLLFALALALALPARAALAAPLRLALSDTAAQDSPEALADAYFAQLVEERTDGRVRIELHLDGALYADDALAVEALILGETAFARVPADAAAAFSPGLYVLQMPGLYADDAHMTAALADARAGGLALDAMRPAGLIGLCFYDGGPRGVVTGDGGPGDGGPGDGWPGGGALSGLRVRVPDGASARALAEALDVQPVPQGAQEAVDGAMGPWSVCASFPGAACYWELDHARALSVLLASEMALAAAGVSDTDLTAIVQCAQETQRYQFEAQAAREEHAQAAAQAAGVQRVEVDLQALEALRWAATASEADAQAELVEAVRALAPEK